MPKEIQRLDRILVHMGVGSRSEIQKLIKQGRVKIAGVVQKDPSLKISRENLVVQIDEKSFAYQEFWYYMLHKPAGLISASRGDEIVLDLLDIKDQRPGLFPVGRLDKDTEGLLLLTNDGELAHRLLSPRRHVPKCYFLHYEGMLDSHAQIKFKQGISIDDEQCLPAELIISDSQPQQAHVILHEGKFHQVKRMIQAVNGEVTYLKRISFGPLDLDESLKPGEYRELSFEEIEGLRKVAYI